VKTIAPFGFVTGCHAGDRMMVCATLSSIRHFCPDAPICLVVDGTFDISDLRDQYQLSVLRISDLPSVEMRNLIGGNFRAKLAAMWEGPFEFYVWLDSDAIVWGDFRPSLCPDVDFQIFWRENRNEARREEPGGFEHYYFNPSLLSRFDPSFRPTGNTYFCSGAFACRRNAIPFGKWVTAESWLQAEPQLFAWGEQGVLNYLVHSMAQRGEMVIAEADLQHVWAHHGVEELIADCSRSGWRFPSKIDRARVAHFCYRKPFIFDRLAYSRPFTIARLEHLRRRHSELGAWYHLLKCDGIVLVQKAIRRLKKRPKRNETI
jgi:hypothetical protein